MELSSSIVSVLKHAHLILAANFAKPAWFVLELPKQLTTNETPVIATAAAPEKFGEVAALMKSVQSLLPGYNMLVYDLGLSASDQLLVRHGLVV